MTDYSIRPATDADAVAIHEVIAAAFSAPAKVADLWDEVVRRGHDRGSIVALDDHTGRVIGHVGLSEAWVDARRELVDVWILSPLSTRPDRQQQGIGGALIEAAVEATREAGVPALFLEGSPELYGRRGFEPASARGFLPASARTPDLAFQVALLDAWEDWMTGALVYRDVWWEYDAAGVRDPDLADLEKILGRGRTHVR